MKAFNPNMSDPDVQELYKILHDTFVKAIEPSLKQSAAGFVETTGKQLTVDQIVETAVAMGFLQAAIEMMRAELLECGELEGDMNVKVARFRELLGTVLPKYEVDVSSIENPAGGKFTFRRGGRHRNNGSEST